MFDKIDVLDKGYVRLVEPWGFGDAGEPEAGIIEAARQSTQGSFRGWDWSCNKCPRHYPSTLKKSTVQIEHSLSGCDGDLSNDTQLIKYLYNNQHSTPFEFAGMTIEVKAPIFVFREWHRHRTQSYNEMSARYAPLPDEAYVPSKERLLINSTDNKQAGAMAGAFSLNEASADEFLVYLEELYEQAQYVYSHGLKLGVPKELARLALPVSRYSQMRASANLRNWIGFLKLRQDSNAQWEIRQYADAVASIIEKQFNKTYQLYKTGTIGG